MKIVACYKNVPEEDIVVKQDKSLDFSKSQWKIGQYDLNAVEAGLRLKEEHGGSAPCLNRHMGSGGNLKASQGHTI